MVSQNKIESEQDYLETILILSQSNPSVRAIDIVNYMNYSKPSISIAMKKLQKQGYIEINQLQITLTPIGLEIAKKVYERHVVLTSLFTSLGVSEEIAKKDACLIEHDLSEETFNAIKKHFEQKNNN